jgi:chromosomal replication initiation ATPase DnaA
LKNDRLAWRLLELVARWCDISPAALLHPTRCRSHTAFARQLAMYLLHVQLQRPYEAVGQIFGRSSRMVSSACARVEDLRDDDGWDRQISDLEAALQTEQNKNNEVGDVS